MDFTVTYISNSGFILETEEILFVFDYQGDQPQLVNSSLWEKGKKLVFLASHSHGDHFSRKILDFSGKLDTALLLSGDIHAGDLAQYINEREETDIFGVKVEAYGSTDLGVSFLLDINGKRIFHAGDLNCWHWSDESTPQESQQAKDFFDRIIATIKPPIDIAFFPVDPRIGSGYDLGADIFIKKFRPKLFFPMHFRDAVYAATDFKSKHEGNPNTQIIPLTNAGEKYGGSI